MAPHHRGATRRDEEAARFQASRIVMTSSLPCERNPSVGHWDPTTDLDDRKRRYAEG